jgi:AraC-like DNA-binding protein
MSRTGGSAPVGADDDPAAPVVEMDFLPPSPLDERAEQVKALADQGLMLSDVAARLGLHKSQVTAAFKHYYHSRGLTPPDGRARRGTLQVKHHVPPMYQQIAPQVKALYEQGLKLGDIAAQLHCDRATVDQTLKWLGQTSNLRRIDGRARRKALRLARDASDG